MPALTRLRFSPDDQFSGEEVAMFRRDNPKCRINSQW
jgi:hypothetical protein